MGARKATKRAKPKTTSAAKRAGFKRVCILTGGGDAPGLNPVLRAFAKSATQLGIEVLGSEDGFESLIHGRPLVTLDRAAVRGILPKGGSILGCNNRSNPFSYPRKDKRGRETLVDVSLTVLSRIRDEEIDALVLVGGDGTMSFAKRFAKLGVPVVGIPKTIDNDLAATDYTFGFDTALSTATWAIDTLHATAESHDRAMIVEVMGRYAGWIALCAGIGGGADVILIPEIPYKIERVAAKIMQRAERGTSFSIIVVGEGAKPKGGEISTISKGKQGHLPRLGGAGQQLAAQLGDLIPHEIRVTVLGHLQRGGSPSAFDRVLGTRFGVRAAHLCKEGRAGVMVALSGQDVVSVPISQALKRPKLVPPRGELCDVARRVGIELGA